MRPARDGALRVLRASAAAGVERVVLTSNMGAITYGHPKARYLSGRAFDETEWSDPEGPDVNAYVKSKILAEQAAWAFMQEQDGTMQLAAVNPSGIFGPAMGADFSPSLQLIARLLKGDMPALPPMGFSVVDSRDLADLHLLAMTKPQAAGSRFPAGGRWLWFKDVAAILRTGLPPELSAKIPNRNLPGWLLKVGANFSPQLKALSKQTTYKREIDIRAARALGWSPRPEEETLVDTALSLKAVGAV